MAELQQTQANIEAHALAMHVRMSPQKARLVMDLIRGQKAQDALHTLKYTPKRAAKHIAKVLLSAIANAERKAEDAGAPLDVDMLFVAQCFVNEGPRWKRLRPAPMGGCGRASRGSCGTRGSQRGGGRSAEGRARYGAPRSQGFDREASALEK